MPSKRLKQARWNLTLPLQFAMRNKNDIVALNDSQILRWICELNDTENLDFEVSKLKRKIKLIKQEPISNENKNKIKEIYQKL